MNFCLSGQKINQWHTIHDSKSSKQSPKNNKFQGRKTAKCTSIHGDQDTYSY